MRPAHANDRDAKIAVEHAKSGIPALAGAPRRRTEGIY
jgi:hypothetical protein